MRSAMTSQIGIWVGRRKRLSHPYFIINYQRSCLPMVITCAVAVPESVTVWGDPEALSAMERVAVRVPVA